MMERPIGLPAANWPASLVGSGELPDAWMGWQSSSPSEYECESHHSFGRASGRERANRSSFVTTRVALAARGECLTEARTFAVGLPSIPIKDQVGRHPKSGETVPLGCQVLTARRFGRGAPSRRLGRVPTKPVEMHGRAARGMTSWRRESWGTAVPLLSSPPSLISPPFASAVRARSETTPMVPTQSCGLPKCDVQ